MGMTHGYMVHGAWWTKRNIMTWIIIYMVPLVLPQFKCSSNTTLVALNQYIHMHYSFFFHILTTYPLLVVQTNVFVSVFLSHTPENLPIFWPWTPVTPKPILTYDIPLTPPICLISFSLLVLLFPLLPFFKKPKPCISTVSRVLSFGYV